jgi:hypothetical protein
MVGDELIEAITTGGPVAGDHQEVDFRWVGRGRILPAGGAGAVHFSLVAASVGVTGQG